MTNSTQLAVDSGQQFVDRDREYDQTARTDTASLDTRDECYYCQFPERHGHKSGCPNNVGGLLRYSPEQFLQLHPKHKERLKTADTEPTSDDFARPMPSVIEQHNRRTRCSECQWSEGHASNCPKDPFVERNVALLKLAAAETRISQFEKFAQNLAEKLDEMNADCIFLTGKSFDEHLADLNRERMERRDTQTAEPQLCLTPSPLGGGLKCLRDKGHGGPCSTNPQPPPVSAFDVAELGQCEYSVDLYRCKLIEGHTGDHMF